MKILIRDEPMASHFIYEGLANELTHQGNEVKFWNCKQNSAFDAFNLIEPDIFVGQGYNLDRATLKCINTRPNLKVFLKVGIWSDDFNAVYGIKTPKYPVLIASDSERSLVEQIENKDRITVFNYCHPNKVDFVIGGWTNIVRSTWGLLPAADIYTYYPVSPDEKLRCDIGFVGGYWGYKGQNLDRYIIPLCLPIGKYNVKLFGTQAWGVLQYLGYANNDTVRKLFCSAKVCPNIHEPHACDPNLFGDITPRTFNIIACQGFCISDYVEDYNLCFVENELPMVKTPQEFFDLVDFYKQEKNSSQRQEIIDKCYQRVMQEHTYSNRITEFMRLVNVATS